MKVIAQQGDTVDGLCFRHLGSSAAVLPTFDANPGLAALGPVLPIGTAVILPEVVPAKTSTALTQLWD